MQINLNDPVEVVLTAQGAQIWNKYWEDIPAVYRPEVEQEGGVLREQLWHLFEVFAKHISLGKEFPFKQGVITLVKH
jgi:hypothetical protein